MPIRRSIALALVAAPCVFSVAGAGPLARYSWDDCSPLVSSKYFTSPTVYTQTVSLLGLDTPIQDVSLVIGFGSFSIPNAWQFPELCAIYGCPFAGPACQPAGRVSLLLGGSACDTLPGLSLSAHYWFTITPGRSGLAINGTGSGAFTPDPSRRYTLVRIAFDHSGSVAGSGGPGFCGGADEPYQFMIGDLYLNGVDQRGRTSWENCVLTWNSPSYPVDCPLVVPVRDRSWGQIKSYYR